MNGAQPLSIDSNALKSARSSKPARTSATTFTISSLNFLASSAVTFALKTIVTSPPDLSMCTRITTQPSCIQNFVASFVEITTFSKIKRTVLELLKRRHKGARDLYCYRYFFEEETGTVGPHSSAGDSITKKNLAAIDGECHDGPGGGDGSTIWRCRLRV